MEVVFTFLGYSLLSKHLLSGLKGISWISIYTFVSSLMIGWCFEFSIPLNGLRTLRTSSCSSSSLIGSFEGSWCF